MFYVFILRKSLSKRQNGKFSVFRTPSKPVICLLGVLFEIKNGKTITMNSKSHNQKEIFKILVIENDSTFYETLLEILSSCLDSFPLLKFKIEKASTHEDLEEPDMKAYDLVFIEDNALMQMKKQKETVDFVLLLNGQFFEHYATRIKKIITKKSLNLYEHISLTNYSFELVKVLVVDFIKAKAHV